MAGRPSRELLASGELQWLITGRPVVGVTTNPTIFASALAKGDRYDAQLSHLAELGASTEAAVFFMSLGKGSHGQPIPLDAATGAGSRGRRGSA